MAISASQRAHELSWKIDTRQGCCDKCVGKKEALLQLYDDRHANLFAKRYGKWKRALLEAEKKEVQDGKDYIEYLNKLQADGQTLDDLNVIAAFCASHEGGKTPEPWVMNRLHSVFSQFLDDGLHGGNANIDEFFDLKKTDFNGMRRYIDTEYNESLGSYAILQYLFEMKHEKTAEVIKLWYADTRKANVITQQFLREYQPYIDPQWQYRMDNEMTKTARATIFLKELKRDNPKAFEKLKLFKTHMGTNKHHPALK